MIRTEAALMELARPSEHRHCLRAAAKLPVSFAERGKGARGVLMPGLERAVARPKCLLDYLERLEQGLAVGLQQRFCQVYAGIDGEGLVQPGLFLEAAERLAELLLGLV